MPTIELEANVNIPVIGLGTWQITGQECYEAVTHALQTGYRHIDTADAYNNHEQVGNAIADSGVRREDLFVTSKVWRSDLRHYDLLEAGKRTLSELNLDYLDLYLVHWPNREIPLAETLGAMQELKDQGRIRAYGVSNFNTHHLQDALQTGYNFVNNQVEYHPSLNQQELLNFAVKNNITLTAYSPLAQGQDFQLKPVQEIAGKYQKTEAQVILRWLIQKGVVVIPRSANTKHIENNFAVIDWSLAEEDMSKLDSVDKYERLIEPGFADFEY